jgi:hypothetical protein
MEDSMATSKSKLAPQILMSGGEPSLYVSADGILVFTQHPRLSDRLVAAFGRNEIVVLLEHVIGRAAAEDVVEMQISGEVFLERGHRLNDEALQKMYAFIVNEWRPYRTQKVNAAKATAAGA